MKTYTYSMPQQFIEDKSVPVQWKLYGLVNGFWIGGKTVYATNEWLAKELKCSERHVSRSLELLEKAGLITRDIEGFKRLILPGGMTPGVKGGRRGASAEGDVGRQHTSDSISDNIPCELGSSHSEDSFIPGGAVLVPVSDSGESKQPREKKEPRVKDKESIYLLFSKGEQPWWRHAQQKKAALSLFDLVGYERVKAGVAFMHEHLEDKYCPQAGTPFEYEEKMPALAQYVKRNKS